MKFLLFSLSLLFIFLLPASGLAQDTHPSSLEWIRAVPVEAEMRPATADPDLLHPMVKRLLSTSPSALEAAFEKQREVEAALTFDLVVYLREGEAALVKPGRWVRVTDSRYMVRMNYDELVELVGQNIHRWIEPAVHYQPQVNRARAESGANFVHQGLWNGVSYTGENTLTGIFDSGIDVTHPAFRNPEDTLQSRVRYLWDQTLTPQAGEQSPPAPFDYGVLFTRDDIEAALAAGQPLRSLDINGHGTHVTGIATGGGPQFKGLAPDTDLVVIKGGNNSFSALNIVNGTKFMGFVSETYQLPIVGNFSIGGQFAARDGTESTEVAMDEVSEQAGVVMVSAAGNSGAQLRFFEGMAGTDDIILDIPSYTPRAGALNDRLLVDIWFDSDTEAELTVQTPAGTTATWTPGMSTTLADSSEGVISVDNIIHAPNGQRRIIFYVGDDVEEFPPAEGQWRLSLSGTQQEFKSWMVLNTVGSQTISQQGATTDYTITSPGTGISTITVGAYVMQNNWLDVNGNLFQFNTNPLESLAVFSGIGPTRDGRMKPEITAPGRFVVAARSRSSNYAGLLTVPGSEYVWLAGTSMSAPVVTGAVALLLQAFPTARSEDIKEALIQSARRDEFTGPAFDNQWGGGKLDIIAALDYLEGNVGERLWEPNHIFATGSVKPSGEDSFNINQVDGVVYKLPEFRGILNGLTLHTGVLNPGNEVLKVTLLELNNNNSVVRELGEPVRIELAELNPLNEQYIDVSELGVLIPDGLRVGLLLTLDDQNGEAGLLELLGRSVTFPSSGASTWLYDAQTQSLQSRNGEMVYMDVASTSFFGDPDDAPPGYTLPFEIALGLNYPNPFAAQTIIPYEIQEQSQVELHVYDVLGRRVARLVNEAQEPGLYEIPFDGSRLASGIYLYRLRVNGTVLTGKMALVK